ncbi:MAG TPA: sirohydrochlorin chelatase [Actinomycetes bacterium]|nr:sirohydrochlorin chelatase [Actinomycetes bacterium]
MSVPDAAAGTGGPAGRALLLAGHGSRDAAGTGECHQLAERVRRLSPGLPVRVGFIEHSRPPLSAAVAELVAEGARHVVAVPLVLLGAGHAKTDVPASVQLARRAFPGVRFTYGAPLGLHPDLLAIVDERLEAAVPPERRRDTAVLLVGRGSSDPDANADLHKVARLLWEGRDWPLVETAFVGITGPRVPEGLERCRMLGARRVAVVPYFLFTGVLERRIARQAATARARHPELDVTVTGYLGPDERIARLALARYEQTLRGAAGMTCDLCVYRAPMRGFEQLAGAPAAPHAHPDDPHTRAHRHG